MRFLSSGLVLALAAGAAFILTTTPALAAETSNSEFVIIREDDVFPEDLYAGAISVAIEGTLDGDLIAFAAEEIVINGSVNGSVTAVTPNITVNGEVEGSLRVTGNRLSITGEVGGDVVAAVVNAELSPESAIADDLLLWSWNASVLGSVGADFTGTQRNLDLAGDIGGDVEVSVTRFEVVDPLTVSGDLGYRSGIDAEGLDQASVEGAIVDKMPLPPNLRIRALGLLGRFLVIVFLSLAALGAAYGWPRRTTHAIGGVGKTPIRRWVIGALILFSPLIAVAVTGLILGLAPAAAALPLLAVLVPVILALLGISFALALVAGAPTVGWLGGVLFKRLDLYGSTLVGSLIVGVFWYLPFVSWLVPIVVLPLGLGAWIASWRSQESVAESLEEAAS